MISQIREVARLRRAGLSVAWSASVQRDRHAALTFGRDCHIGRGSLIVVVEGSGQTGRLALGAQVHIGEYNNIRAAESFVEIGNRVLFSQFVSVIATNHVIADHVQWEGIDSRQGVRIGSGCWLGTQSVILPGVDLGDDCVVGAGAVVTRSFPPRSKLVGVPARPLQPA